MRRISILLLFAAVGISTRVMALDNPPFPRLAANWIGNQNYQDPHVQRQLARFNIATIDVWPGWENGRGTTVEKVVENIKAINPNTLVFEYIDVNEIWTDRSGAGGPYKDLYSKLDAMHWYLYANGASGTMVNSTYPGSVILNTTLFTRADSNGDRLVEWFPKWAVKTFIGPSPSLDGFNSDNVFWIPRVNGDWNLDGRTDSSKDPTVREWFRQGYVRHFSVLKQLTPGKYQIGNVADWGDQETDISDYQGMLHGGVMEGMVGYSWSVENWGGWKYMMAWYRKTMHAFAEPKLGIFHQVGNASDYQCAMGWLPH
jgi:hypothetical protein